MTTVVTCFDKLQTLHRPPDRSKHGARIRDENVRSGLSTKE